MNIKRSTILLGILAILVVGRGVSCNGEGESLTFDMLPSVFDAMSVCPAL